tara:strand:- start:914 stop:1156 length:243 start_codon:yes stop_codon:yes gene_type:complete
MTRNELKQLWFTLPTSKVLKKCIIVEPNYGHVEIMSDGPDGYSSFKTNQGENALQYALDRIEESKGCKYRDLSEYQLIIK